MSYSGNDVEYVAVTRVIGESERALLCQTEAGLFWIPRAVVNEDDSDVEGLGDRGSLAVAKWYARREGIS